MFKYIGIRGHRGAGKNTISFLLGASIDFYTKNNNWDGFDDVYADAVNIAMNDDSFIENADFVNVFFESFADTPKIMLSQLLGIPSEYFYNDWSKDSIIVNMKDFTFIQAKDKLELQRIKDNMHLYDADELARIANFRTVDNDEREIHTTLRELISYFSKNVMQIYFGPNVWIKSLNANRWEQERFYTGRGKTIYKIFTDCKFPSEVSYIYNNGGKIIKVNRENNVKEDTQISKELDLDPRFDYEINLDGDLMKDETKEDVKRLTLKIIEQ